MLMWEWTNYLLLLELKKVGQLLFCLMSCGDVTSCEEFFIVFLWSRGRFNPMKQRAACSRTESEIFMRRYRLGSPKLVALLHIINLESNMWDKNMKCYTNKLAQAWRRNAKLRFYNLNFLFFLERFSQTHKPKLLLLIIYLDPQQTKSTAALPGAWTKQGHSVTLLRTPL